MNDLAIQLGHDIPTGMAIRNPITGMVPFASYAFSSVYWEDLNSVTLPTAPAFSGSYVWSSWLSHFVRDGVYISESGRVQIVSSVTPPALNYGSWIGEWYLRLTRSDNLNIFYNTAVRTTVTANPLSYAETYTQPASGWDFLSSIPPGEYRVDFYYRTASATPTSYTTSLIQRRFMILPM